MNRRISVMSTQEIKRKNKVNNLREFDKSFKIDKTKVQIENAKNLFQLDND